MAIRSNYFRRRNLNRIRNSRRLEQFLEAQATRMNLTTTEVFALLQAGNSAETLQEIAGWSHCTNKAGMNANGESSGSNQAVTYRTRFVTKRAVTQLRLVFSNSRLAATPSEIDADQAVTYEATVETGVGTNTVAVTFGGASSVTLAAGASIVSDPLTITFAGETAFFVRTRASVETLGMTWPVYRSGSTADGEGFSTTNFLTGAVPGLSNSGMVGPSAILAPDTSPTRVIVGVIGSSSAAGQGDTADASLNLGYLERAMFANNVPCTKLAVGSDTIAKFLANNVRRFQHLDDAQVSHVIFQLGSNDLTSGRTLAQIQADLKTAWNLLRLRGYRILQTTYTPVTTSSDSWATVANQTVVASNSVRIALNTWLATQVGVEFDKLLDCHTAVEAPGADAGKFQASMTADGTHLNATAHAAVATALGTAIFA